MTPARSCEPGAALAPPLPAAKVGRRAATTRHEAPR
jgi:hypothetical protein